MKPLFVIKDKNIDNYFEIVGSELREKWLAYIMPDKTFILLVSIG